MSSETEELSIGATPQVTYSEPRIQRVAWFHVVGPAPEDTSWGQLKDWVLANNIDYTARRFVGYDNPHPMVANPHGYEAQMLLEGSEGLDGSFLGAKTKAFNSNGLYITTTVPITKMQTAWDAVFSFVKENGLIVDTERRQYFEEHLFPAKWFCITHDRAKSEDIASEIGFRIWLPVLS